ADYRNSRTTPAFAIPANRRPRQTERTTGTYPTGADLDHAAETTTSVTNPMMLVARGDKEGFDVSTDRSARDRPAADGTRHDQ
ncbi:hypothetical protein, partial [Nocardia anaemiae]|uniref:hypothetical protein n=1 Tax=Nocardia anaemiae TaxID=263910 RepID=UPI001C3F9D6A